MSREVNKEQLAYLRWLMFPPGYANVSGAEGVHGARIVKKCMTFGLTEHYIEIVSRRKRERVRITPKGEMAVEWADSRSR